MLFKIKCLIFLNHKSELCHESMTTLFQLSFEVIFLHLVGYWSQGLLFTDCQIFDQGPIGRTEGLNIHHKMVLQFALYQQALLNTTFRFADQENLKRGKQTHFAILIQNNQEYSCNDHFEQVDIRISIVSILPVSKYVSVYYL